MRPWVISYHEHSRSKFCTSNFKWKPQKIIKRCSHSIPTDLQLLDWARSVHGYTHTEGCTAPHALHTPSPNKSQGWHARQCSLPKLTFTLQVMIQSRGCMLCIIHISWGHALGMSQSGAPQGPLLSPQNASMCLGAISITSEREEVVDFSKPYKQKMFSLLMKKPKEKSSIFQFLWPLSPFVWILIISSLTIVGIQLFVMDRISPNSQDTELGRFNLSESLWFMYGSLVGAGTEMVPRTISGRLLTGSWWFFALILVSSYTANLAAFLTVTKIETPIKSIADLAAQTTIKYGTVKNTYASSMFRNSKLELFQKMWTFMNNINSDAMVDNTSVGLEKVKAGDYAFIWDAPINKYLSFSHCDTMTVGEPFDEKGYGIGVPLGAAYRDDITMAILSLSEEGVMQSLENRSEITFSLVNFLLSLNVIIIGPALDQFAWLRISVNLDWVLGPISKTFLTKFDEICSHDLKFLKFSSVFILRCFMPQTSCWKTRPLDLIVLLITLVAVHFCNWSVGRLHPPNVLPDNCHWESNLLNFQVVVRWRVWWVPGDINQQDKRVKHPQCGRCLPCPRLRSWISTYCCFPGVLLA